ncbi:hypothetical protein [Aurantiacibacter gangjinensis]|nr:hypothetical protein [Aurantiacibacter gangjinensis]
MCQPLESVIGGQREFLEQIVELDARIALLLVETLYIRMQNTEV